ncbi:glycosyltransferase family 4 protein [Paenibacillus cisolokensis]|uniref:glycosyltransferase family 4 protein n=1 Tax=Paenibacillus cisolokensis TaxID=1658519 RepID=UPI003D2A186D
MISKLRYNEFLARKSRLSLAQPQRLELRKEGAMDEKLKVVYVMNHVSICGGVKIIIEHANRLKEQGWEVCIVCHFPRPEWYPILVEYKQVPFGIELAKGIPLCDVIVATCWDHIQACIETGIAPVVYFEQGDDHLFHLSQLADEKLFIVKEQLQLPQFIMTVSNQAALLLEKNYGRESVVIPNAIDHNIFNPDLHKTVYKQNPSYILMLGNENTAFKRIDLIVRAFKRVKQKHPAIKLFWINQVEPSESWVGIADEVFVNPPQEKIADLYKHASLFVSASEFESFSLPVLEAMAVGCPVISAKNTGVMEYGTDNVNIVFSEIGNEDDLVLKILYLLENDELRDTIVKNGLETAQKYKWSNTITQLSEYLISVTGYIPTANQSIEDWDIRIEERQFTNIEDIDKFKKILQHVSEGVIYVPVLYDWLENHPIARWEIAATRKNMANNRSFRIFTPVMGRVENIQQLKFGEGIQYVIEERYDRALDYFIAQYSSVSEEWKFSCSKWIVLCLIELNRDNDALKVIGDVLQINDKFSDGYYLYYMLLRLNNHPQADQIAQVINFLGDNLDENEWFFDLKSKLDRSSKRS